MPNRWCSLTWAVTAAQEEGDFQKRLLVRHQGNLPEREPPEINTQSQTSRPVPVPLLLMSDLALEGASPSPGLTPTLLDLLRQPEGPAWDPSAVGLDRTGREVWL